MPSETKPAQIPSLVAFDLDDTTLDHGDKDMHPRVQAALERIHELGAATAVVSGRPIQMLRPIQAHSWVDWLITMNGSLVMRASDEKPLYGKAISRDDVVRSFDAVGDLGPGLGVIMRTGMAQEQKLVNYMLRGSTPQGVGEQAADAALKELLADTVYIDSAREYVFSTDEDIYKIQMSFPDVPARDEAHARLAVLGCYELADMGVVEIEITARGVNKGTALDQLCALAGIDQARSVAFGDSGNDLQMAGHVGTLVAMGNATPEFKAVADEVCPPITEQGVARWLEETCLS